MRLRFSENKISLEHVVQRRAGITCSELDGETVMMSIDRGAYYGLGTVGSRVWELLGQPISVGDIAAMLCREFQGDAGVIENDICSFIEKLHREDLIQIHAAKSA